MVGAVSPWLIDIWGWRVFFRFIAVVSFVVCITAVRPRIRTVFTEFGESE